MSIFKDILEESSKGFGYTKSEDWYREQVRLKLKPANDLNVGDVLFFEYNPKLKLKLPYWDRYPLIRLLERHNDGFLGLNVHYVYPEMRSSILTGSAAPPKCVHKYLYENVRSSVRQIPVEEIEGVSLLPIEKFYKTVNRAIRPAKKEKIWKL